MADGRYEANATNSGIVQLSDAQYDFFREVLEKVFPAAIAFYALVGGYLKWGNIVEVTGIMGGLAVFLGVVLSLARKGYSPPVKEVASPPTSFDGEVKVVGVTENNEPIAQIVLNDNVQKNFLTTPVITIKGFDENA
ncbi:holin [Arthrobacter phage MediumFry]|nr:holin [Arthrobacter phage MediumFry]